MVSFVTIKIFLKTLKNKKTLMLFKYFSMSALLTFWADNSFCGKLSGVLWNV